ncbi:MAG: FtsW/RodA/SpoVE family cell cycle protein [Clostridiales bacterium]|nr:FtsW/RodA/SpoVE family cell cycle protein [Clostridiales bacterium]
MSKNQEFRQAVKNYFKKTDFLLLTVAIVASGYGLVLISSVGTAREMIVQTVGICLGITAYIVLTIFDIEHLSAFWKVALILNLLLLSLTLFFGEGSEETGNNSWIRINLSSSLQVGFQPAEVGKVIYIFTLAKHFKVLGDRLNTFKGLLMLGLHAIIPVMFVFFFSDDDGMAASYLFIFVVMAFAGGIYLRYCFAGILAFAGALPLLWFFVFSQYQKDRFIVLFDSTYKTDTVGYHQSQSLAAIQSGGFWGDGYGKGSICQYDYLPADHTDFIFCVACEEFGFFGGLLILVLLSSLILICVFSAISMRDDKFSMLCCVGVAAMLTFQTFINVGMCLRVAPVIGLTLPFFSYGGTSVLTMFIALGLVASLKGHYIKRAYNRSPYEE